MTYVEVMKLVIVTIHVVDHRAHILPNQGAASVRQGEQGFNKVSNDLVLVF